MKKGILIYGPTPLFGGQLGANKQDIINKLFGVGNNKKLIEHVLKEIQHHHLNWQFDFDPTEANSDEIIKSGVDLIVVLPTLEKKFDAGAIPKDKIIQLTSLDYQQNDVTKIVTYMLTHS